MRFGKICKFAAAAVVTTAAVAIMLLSGCLHDETDPSLLGPSGPVEFQMSVYESESIRTRLDSVYIDHTAYDVDFVIELNTKDKGGDVQKTEIYTVPPGYEGRLTAKEGKTPLDWVNLTEPHSFYGWTNSYLPPKDKNGSATVYPAYPTDGKDINEEYGGSDENGKFFWVTFHDSPETEKGSGTGYDLYHNNDYLEKFIGTTAGPYSYVEHGRYVMLTFKHLVSKIRIDRMALIKPDGTIDYSVRGDMTFIGLPKKAKFYPHPNDGETWPYVKAEEEGDVTYFIENKAGEEDYFYICPEVDFSKIGFKINLNDEQYGSEGNYYGDFKEVQFVRENGTDYDLGEEIDDTILHAGEEMTLSIRLVPGVGPGIALIIKDWNTEKPDEAVHHTHPGIYTDGEVKEFLDIFLNHKSYDPTEIEDALQRFLEMYGWTDDEGIMHFPLFDNVTIDSNIFPIFKNCIIDGKGHTITMTANKYNTSYVTGPYFNIGPVRNVWITDGENTVYIGEDEEGLVWVWYYDQDGVLQKGDQLTKLEKNSSGRDEKSYDISCVNGKVHKSDYYNNTVNQ